MNQLQSVTPEARTRNRRALVMIAALIFGPVLLALALNYGGLLPSPKTNGERIDPMIALADSTLHLQDGTPYRWTPEARMKRLLVIAPPGCDAACGARAADLEKVRELFGKEAEHLDLLWMGDFPADAPRPPTLKLLRDDPAVRAQLPRTSDAKGAPVYLIDPYGFVVLRFPPDLDLALLRKDVSKLMKLQ
ncbi:hypothetical protein DCD74_09295 [Lysobacter oculi]|uniref:Thioredoxin domain-containing protein n=1 Tax=Solilutibacter oculi TaxID=2698682 RepID=A0A344J742_9GAMM|nr:hypothetical protein [Lysobacter oculi]AXA84852.1 hypothetical protein DCD74_09295 [Lysobacter oculi]